MSSLYANIQSPELPSLGRLSTKSGTITDDLLLFRARKERRAWARRGPLPRLSLHLRAMWRDFKDLRAK